MNELKLPFQKTIDELLAGKKSLSRSSLRSFSDIDSVSLNLLLEAWPRIALGPQAAPARRASNLIR